MTIPHPDLLLSLSQIPFSSPILHLMSRFWDIRLSSNGQIPYSVNKFCVFLNPSPYFGSKIFYDKCYLVIMANVIWHSSSYKIANVIKTTLLKKLSTKGFWGIVWHNNNFLLPLSLSLLFIYYDDDLFFLVSLHFLYLRFRHLCIKRSGQKSKKPYAESDLFDRICKLFVNLE